MREPTNSEEKLMIIGGFETLEEMYAWFNRPPDPALIAQMGEPDMEEEILEEWEERRRREEPTEEELEEDEFIRKQIEE